MVRHPHPLGLAAALLTAAGTGGRLFALGRADQPPARPLGTPSAETRFVDSLPPYKPAAAVSGTLRLWGHGSFKHDFMGRLVKYWTDGFTRHHPGVTIENRMYGTASAIGALYAGAGDLAILGEEIQPAMTAAFRRVKGYPPLGIEIATGSLDVRNFDYAHVFFVHRDNPLSRITLAQLDGVFGAEHRRGPVKIRTWGQLGLTGEWADRAIRPYGWRLDDDFALYLQDALLAGSHRWNNDLREFAHVTRPDGSIHDHGQQILDALAEDPSGIAVSNLRYANSRVKPLAVGTADGGPFHDATTANLITRRYPFTRIIPAFVDRAPGRPVDLKVAEFLRYVLSREGQQDVVRDGGYLPLSEQAVGEELRTLEGPASSPREAPSSASTPRIRIWGNDRMAPIARLWQEGFEQRHPGVGFETRLMGTGTAMAGLYTGVADLAFMGREATPKEIMAFEWVFRYKPTRVELMTGSLDRAGHSPALVAFVHRENPASRITLAQLDAIFGYERRRGHAAVQTWDQLGLDGRWSGQTIHAYLPDVDTGTGGFFRRAVLKESYKLSWEVLREFPPADRSGNDSGRPILDALAEDRFGIAVASLGDANPEVKPLALAVEEGGPWVDATRESLVSRRYPLTRVVYAYVNRAPSRPLDPDVREFLRYVLSPEGQGSVARQNAYLPLAADVAREQLRSLE